MAFFLLWVALSSHVISEYDRVLKAVYDPINGDFVNFGQLMNKSDAPEKKDYEVRGSDPETIYIGAWQIDIALGARTTGTGFGGCNVNIVRHQRIGDFMNRAGENYFESTGLKGEFYVATVGKGAEKL